MFKKAYQSTLLNIFRDMELFTFKMNTLVYKEGDVPKYLYFVKEGEVDIYKKKLLVSEKKDNNEKYFTTYKTVQLYTKNKNLMGKI